MSADLLCSSLTKGFNGRGDCLAGSLIVNKRGRYSKQLIDLLPSLYIPGLYHSDAIVLEANSRDYPQRCHQSNVTTHRLVTWLRRHRPSLVEDIYYSTVLDADYTDTHTAKNVSTTTALSTAAVGEVVDDKCNGYLSIMRTSDHMCSELQALSFQAGFGSLFSLVFKKGFDQKVGDCVCHIYIHILHLIHLLYA